MRWHIPIPGAFIIGRQVGGGRVLRCYDAARSTLVPWAGASKSDAIRSRSRVLLWTVACQNAAVVSPLMRPSLPLLLLLVRLLLLRWLLWLRQITAPAPNAAAATAASDTPCREGFTKH